VKRRLVAIVALIACFAIGAATFAIAAKPKKKKHVSSSVTLTITAVPPPYNQAGAGQYQGNVTSRRHRCEVDRTVAIRRNGATIGNSHTDENGHYAFATVAAPEPGTYTAKAKKKSFKNKKHTKTFLCKPAVSNPVNFP